MANNDGVKEVVSATVMEKNYAKMENGGHTQIYMHEKNTNIFVHEVVNVTVKRWKNMKIKDRLGKPCKAREIILYTTEGTITIHAFQYDGYTERKIRQCDKCGGTGQIEVVLGHHEENENLQMVDYRECPDCHGGWK